MNKRNARSRRGTKTKSLIKNSNRPRLVIFRSITHIYAQIVESTEKGDKVIAVASTVDKSLRGQLKGNKVEQAYAIGELIGKRALENKVKQVAFDRSGNKYHGRVKALAQGAREAGLDF